MTDLTKEFESLSFDSLIYLRDVCICAIRNETITVLKERYIFLEDCISKAIGRKINEKKELK